MYARINFITLCSIYVFCAAITQLSDSCRFSCAFLSAEIGWKSLLHNVIKCTRKQLNYKLKLHFPFELRNGRNLE